MGFLVSYFFFSWMLVWLNLVHGGAGFECGTLAKQIIVDIAGHGNFRSVHTAVNSISLNNKHWIWIKVMPGEYWETVKIPKEKPCIFLEGSGWERTRIVNNVATSLTATFTLLADNFVAKRISFQNTYNVGVMKTRREIVVRVEGNQKQAVAAQVGGDKVAFYDCAFSSYQDTLWDMSGRHYFHNCLIRGAVDFIFGSAESLYEECDLNVIADPSRRELGYVTAQGRERGEDSNGFWFKKCIVFGTGQAYLGRAWRGHSRVVFEKTEMGAVVHPKGWSAWNYKGHENDIVFAEWECVGSGSNTSNRVGWMKNINNTQVKDLQKISLINIQSWLKGLPH